MPKSVDKISIDARLGERVAPALPVVMYQRWEELLFLHWAVEPEEVAKHLPPGLEVDTFDGRAWIGVVPFTMRDVRPRFLPALPRLSNFPELNLRTYVVDDRGRPGVWFYSLDTPKHWPNWIARTFFHLNYRLARIRVQYADSGCVFQSELRNKTTWDAPQNYAWQRVGAPYTAERGSLDFFLVERYRLFAYDIRNKRLLTGKVCHEPYPLQAAALECFSTQLFRTNGLPQPEGMPASVLASAGVKVRIFPMETARA